MLKLGAIGTASSHLAHFARELVGDLRIVRALALPGDPRSVPAGIELREAAEDFADGLDGILVLTRDGRNHAAEALPYLTQGLPVFVDKPLACDLISAERIAAAGRVASFSVLRFLPEVETLRHDGARLLEIRVPGNGASPNAGFWFLGIHGAELACALAGRPRLEAVIVSGGVLTARFNAGGGVFDLVLDPAASGYEIVHSGGHIVLDADAAYRQGARRLERFFAGEDVIATADMLALVALLEEVLTRGLARPIPKVSSLA
jgi:predicted dehydrogenase